MRQDLALNVLLSVDAGNLCHQHRNCSRLGDANDLGYLDNCVLVGARIAGILFLCHCARTGITSRVDMDYTPVYSHQSGHDDRLLLQRLA